MLAALFSTGVGAADEVLIAAVHFPPYVIKPESNPHNGLLGELVDALNKAQSEHRFALRATSLNRRFDDFRQARFHVAIFENPDWNWQGISGTRVDLGLEDAEILVARAEPGRDQRYFDKLMGKRMALFNGYHYGFAGFNNDPKWLEQNFNAVLTYSHESNLNLVLRGRADVAPITRSWLGARLREQPQLQQQLLISDWEDQRYRHYAILSPRAPISAEDFRTTMQILRDNGQLQQIFAPYGIDVRPNVAGSSATAHASD
ncbi:MULTISPECIES: amino acid ABC transporter substrate-binding protein [unclassified Pseudomonas]|uniref:amino acid ABC transporter substrate-binding protein n=1 Tax=unclassified Pseudomonas TaxID=196821 RepID=UPI00244BC07A|nr:MULTISPECIES: amino acid ABC transporter substrate-binding protein [unclassified Pseudomonas]MDG9923674.1 amino acid ABC transporter substrate-binding protein [Pseudomonas sp. GD04045]MDH0036436.1 amino acid ABC transporter substrate-binding protein [Pseudomonas sp. GD04019]